MSVVWPKKWTIQHAYSAPPHVVVHAHDSDGPHHVRALGMAVVLFVDDEDSTEWHDIVVLIERPTEGGAPFAEVDDLESRADARELCHNQMCDMHYGERSHRVPSA